MPATYEPIASTTVNSATANITMSDIPSTYTDLIIICRAGTSYGDNQVWTMRFNSDTGSNYSMTRLGGNGSSAWSDRWTSQTSIDAGFLPTGGLGTSIVQVQSYANTNVNKTCLLAIETQASTSGNAGRQYVARQVGLWRSTAAITSVTFAFTNNMVSGSSVSLYGIKAAWHEIAKLWVHDGGALMPTTMKLIAKTTLGSNASSVSFDSVPGTYTDLVVLFSARSSNSGTFIDGAFPRFNNDTTAGNYSARRLFGDGGGAFSDTNGNVALIPTAQNTASTFGNAAIYIPNYAGSTNKSYSVESAQETNASTAYVCASAGLWSNTAAITRVDIFATAGNNFVTHSSFYLYGITKA